MEKVIDDVHNLVDAGLDQVEPQDKLMIDTARAEAMELLLELRNRFYKLMLG